MSQCQNCQTPLNPENNYCPNCSQSRLSLTQPFTKTASQALHEMLDIDGRLATTIKNLIFYPGLLSKEFIKGRRVSYTPPLRMYLVISLMFFVMISLIQTSANSQGNIQIAFLLFPIGTLEKLPKLMLLMLPVYAALIKIFYRKSYYVGNLIFSLHLHSFMYLMFIIVFPMNQYDKEYEILYWLQYPFWAYFTYYPLRALKVMYEKSWFYTILVYLFSFVLYMGIMGLSLEIIYSYFI